MGESITKSVIEAMSLEKAPIITDIAGNVELVEDGKSGLIVPKKNSKKLSEAILKLYKDRGLTKLLAKNAKERIKTELTTEKTIIKVKALYESLLD
jgi:glycosyltransferase involved in cell wall biosynthesis